jgi:hypothetical protein
LHWKKKWAGYKRYYLRKISDNEFHFYLSLPAEAIHVPILDIVAQMSQVSQTQIKNIRPYLYDFSNQLPHDFDMNSFYLPKRNEN